MSITLGELNSSQGFLNKLVSLELPISVAYKLNNLVKTITHPLEFYQTEWKKIVDRYAEREEDGAYKYTKIGNNIVIQHDKIEECNQALIDLDKVESDVNVKLLTDEDFAQFEKAGLKLTAREIIFYEMFKA